MIVDPWGVVLAQARRHRVLRRADLDFAIQDEMRESLPSLRNRAPSPPTAGRRGRCGAAGQPASIAEPAYPEGAP